MLIPHLQQIKNRLIFASLSNKILEITGTVVEEKILKQFAATQQMSIKLAITSPCSFQLLCYLYTPKRLVVGDQVRLTNVKLTAATTGNRLANTPSFADYLRKEQVLATLFFSKKTMGTFANTITINVTNYCTNS